jgi:hypothetical protein
LIFFPLFQFLYVYPLWKVYPFLFLVSKEHSFMMVWTLIIFLILSFELFWNISWIICELENQSYNILYFQLFYLGFDLIDFCFGNFLLIMFFENLWKSAWTCIYLLRPF